MIISILLQKFLTLINNFVIENRGFDTFELKKTLMPRQEFDFIFQKTNFYGQYWKLDTAKAVIVLVHGMGEHSSRYADFVIPNLLKSDFSVITYDHFGHGKTKGKRGHNPGYAYLLQCIDVVINKANQFFFTDIVWGVIWLSITR